MQRSASLAVAQLAPHLPTHPEQQDAANQQEAQDLQELCGEDGEDDAQHRRGKNADEDRLVALILRQARCRKPDHDGIVARQHQVDHDDLAQCDQGLGGKKEIEQMLRPVKR